jgi:hypothetical protein
MMKNGQLPIKDQKGLMRDLHSKAVLVTAQSSAFQAHQRKTHRFTEMQRQIEELQQQVKALMDMVRN